MVKDTRWKLTTLADYLESVVENGWFALQSWATRGFAVRECGSTACAGGWATQCPAFEGMGLRLVDDGFSMLLKWDKPLGNEKTLTLSSSLASMAFFGITNDTNDYLFMPNNYPIDACDKEHVISRLREIANSPGCRVSQLMLDAANDDIADADGSAEDL